MYPSLQFEFSNSLKNINIKNLKKKIKFKSQNFKRDIKILSFKKDIFIILGRPIIKDKINFKDIPFLFLDEKRKKEINGEFLIFRINTENSELNIMNDRFASIQMFYFEYKKKLYISLNYIDTFKKLIELKILKIREYTFYEFIIFQRLFGTKTYDKKSKFFGSSNFLSFKKGNITQTRYWWPSKLKKFKSLKHNAKILSDLIDQSIKRKFSGEEKKIGFFLSGGVDSRSILYKLNQIKKNITTFTFAPSLNNEAKVAEKVTKNLNLKNDLISFGKNPYKNLIKEMSLLNSMIYEFDHSLFLNLDKKKSKKYELSTSGFGVDSFFQGLMIPFKQIKFYSLPTFFYKVDNEIFYTKNLTNYFIKTFAYRLKTDDYKKIINNKKLENLNKEMKKEFRIIFQLGKKLFTDNIDIYNFMCLNNPSRHFTYNNALSMNQRIKNTCIMYDNDLIEYYYSLPGKIMAFKKIYKAYYDHIPSNIKNIKTGNDNKRYNQSPLMKTIDWYVDKILTKLKLRKKTTFYNPPDERTWPDRGDIIKTKEFKSYLTKMASSNYFEKISFLNKKLIKNFIKDSLKNPNWHNASVIFRLITIHEFLKEVYKK